MTQRFPAVPSPLEVADAALDSVAELIQVVPRAGAAVGQAGVEMAQGIKAAIDKPKNQSEVPATPDVVISGALDTVNAVVGGVAKGVSGVFGAIQETGEGIKGQLDQLVRR